jgi:hypothetical protein
MYFLQKELVTIDQEVKKSGTLFGIPLNPRADGYSEAKIKIAASKLRAALNEYRTR